MPWHLFHVPYPLTNNLCHSILLSSVPCPPSILCHLVTMSPLILIFCIPSLSPLVHIPYSNFLSLVQFLSLFSQHLFITPCLPVPTLTTYYSVPCDSVSHFLHSPYYLICHITLSTVVYKSFQLVSIP